MRLPGPHSLVATALLLGATVLTPSRGAWLAVHDAFGAAGDTAPTSQREPETKKEVKKVEEKRKVVDLKKYQKEQERSKYSELARQKRQEAIDQLKEILKNPAIAGSQKAEMLMRLADLYWEQSKDEAFQEMEEFEKTYDEWFNLPPDEQAKRGQPKPDNTRSQQYTRKAIANYQNILQNYPNYPRIDEAMFYLAFALNDIGDQKEGLEYYNQLVKQYPQSQYVPDAYNAIGEYYFDNNNAYKALQAYRKAASFKDTKIYTFALYKLGWCYYNVGEFREAIETMKRVVAETDRITQAAGKADTGISLKEEALKDLVLFFSEEGDLEEAKEYFTKYGQKKYYRDMLKRLASVYGEQGKIDLSVETYRTLIKEEPLAKDNPEYQNAIIKAMWSRDRFNDAQVEIDRLVSEYGKGSRWSQANADDRSSMEQANEYIERNLRTVAVDAHQQALKRKSQQLLEMAEVNYDKYLSYFPDSKNSYEMRFWYAEVLYKLQKYDVATGQYEKVVEQDGKGKYLKDSASNTIFAIEKYIGVKQKEWDKAAEVQRKAQASSTDPKVKYAPIPLNDWEQRMVKACDTYARVLPDDPKTPNILYKAALMLNDRNQFRESNERFLSIIRANSKTELAQYAVNIILSSYADIEDWEKLNDVAREFYNNPDVGKTQKFKDELFTIYRRATLKLAEETAKDAGKVSDAAEKYFAFYSEFPSADEAPLALFNAGAYAWTAGKKDASLERRKLFIEKFPDVPKKDEDKKRKLFEKCVALLGVHYQSVADYATATRYYEQLVSRDTGFAADGYLGAMDALYNAALFREALGDWQGAVKDYELYVTTYPDQPDVAATRMKIANLHHENKQVDKAQELYKTFFTDKVLSTSAPELVFEARLKYGKILKQKGDVAGMHKHFRDSLAVFAQLPKGDAAVLGLAPLYAAEMEFVVLEPEFEKYKKIAFAADDKEARKALKTKTDTLKKTEEMYVKVIALKQGEWGIAALSAIGELYQDFADKLRIAPCPKKLNEEQCEMYKGALADKAYPLQDKAAEYFRKALEKSYELGLYNASTAYAARKLTEISPAEYPAMAETYPDAGYTSNPFLTAGYISE
ncbi:tetratricopeptide repeat protein [Myxococcota bacterium]|nr:tetratricopeptide repeat protein [Myxococcota bacterium]